MAINLNKLKRAFDLVAPKDDWRGPIAALVTAAQMAEAAVTEQTIGRAIVHFTGVGVYKIEWVIGENGKPNGSIYVTSRGYRAGPCGP